MNMKGVLHISFLMLAATLLVFPVSGAFAVTGIDPDQGFNTELVWINNLSGMDLPQDAGVILMLTGQSNITGQFAYWESPTRITCLLDLGGKAAGVWDVVVVNTSDGMEAILPAGFTIRNPAPTITGIIPDTGVNIRMVDISSIAGTYFLPGVSVQLTKSGEAPVTGTDVAFIDATHLQCRFNLAGVSPGAWDVTISNPDGQSAVLPGAFTVTYQAPVLTGITPASGKNNEVIGITDLAGSNFRDGATVYLSRSGEADIPTIDGPIVTPGKILCFFELNGASVGAWDVVVANSDGQYDSLPGGFTIYYPQAPTITGITPATADNSGPVAISNLEGTGFQPGAAVKLSKEGEFDIPGYLVTVDSSSKILCSFDLTGAEPGAWDVWVMNNDGQSATLAGAFTIVYPAPTVTGINPSTGFNSGPVVIPDLSGTGFLNGASVSLFRPDETDIVAYAVTVETPGRINCTIDLSGAEPGIWSVRITNPDDQSATLTDAFTVKNPSPSVSAISPSSGITGESYSANITGGNFLPGCRANLTRSGEANITGMVTIVTPTKITWGVDLAGAKTGLWSLTVTNPDGQEGILADAFIIYNPAPTVASITPNNGKNNGMTDVLTLKGTGFLNGINVKLTKGGQADIIAKGTPAVENETTITCYFDLSGAVIGSWDVVVTNDDMQSGTLPAGFTISYPAAPQITAITPSTGFNNGSVSIGDLAGSGFEDGAVVVLKQSGELDIPGTIVTVIAPDRITCDFDLTGVKTGAWDVRVTNDDGQYGTFASGFTVRYPPPTVSSITPATGINSGSVAITNLAGTGFLPGAAVKLVKIGEPDIVASGVTVVNTGKINCTFNLAGRAAGPWNVVVTNTDGQYGIGVNKFTIENQAPTVASIAPSSGVTGSTVFISSLSGTGFLPGASVRLTRTGYSPIVATGVNVINSTAINCTIDLTGKAIGNWNVMATNTDGKSGTFPNGFRVRPPLPVPDFTAEPTRGTIPLTVQFTDLSQHADPAVDGVVIWVWNFGDGTTIAGADLKNPVHTYNEVGIYSVTLEIINDYQRSSGQSNSTTKTDYISVVETPIANFTAEPTKGPAPLLVMFTDLSDGNPGKWLWKFGDGAFSLEQNPYHLYQVPGVYSVSLTVSNAAGADTDEQTDFIIVTSIPEADFRANITKGISPLAVGFTDLSTGMPLSWSWKFGDGGTSSDQNPVHVFEEPGTYSVQLTVMNNAGEDTETKDGYIDVGYGLKADFDYTPSNPDYTAPLSVAFMDKSVGDPVRWTWRFGDGYISFDRNPIHNYQKSGTYEVVLTVTGLDGSDSMTKVISVKSPVRAEFVADPFTGSAPLTVVLSDISIGDIADRTWVITTPNTDTAPGTAVVISPGDKNQVYTFNQPGLYTIQLNVVDTSGVMDFSVQHDCIKVLTFP